MTENIPWLNEESMTILNRGYLLTGETVEGAIERICNAAAKNLNRPDLKDEFKNLITKGWISFSSPIWANMGTERGLPISCFNVYIPDSMKGITHKLGEVIEQTKVGGGTSSYFGAIRPRGSAITDNGKSSGPVPFMQLMDTAMNVVSQGGVRRGAHAVYLDVDHPDVEEFLKIKDIGDPIQTLFFGVCIPDYWMQEMIDGDTEKRSIWAKILNSRKDKGLPYVFFTDNVNRNKPQWYKDYNLKINSSNLCFTGDTQVLVKVHECFGSYSFENLYHIYTNFENPVNMYAYTKDSNGDNVISRITKVFKNPKVSELSRLILNNGQLIECTTNHRFLTDNGLVEAKDLNNTHRLISYYDKEPKYVKENITLTLSEPIDVYCLEVEHPDHNFLLNNYNGVYVSNCTEIALPSTEDESFVCCLSSMNLELYDEWKDTNAVQLAIYFLDAVMTEFINKTKDNEFLKASHKFSVRSRALGLGVLGYHSYLQKNMIPFESWEAKQFNNEVFKLLQDESRIASRRLAHEYGEPELLQGYGYRNATLLSIAPTTSSSAILGQASPGIEPFSSNYYKAGLAKGNFMRRNKYLDKLLTEKGINNEDTWRQIRIDQGSVMNIKELSEHEKNVFKTFREISQMEIITQAAQRQKYLDQTQSLNLNIPPEMPIKEVNKLMIEAWKLGVCTLYYQRSASVGKDLIMNLMTCSSCES